MNKNDFIYKAEHKEFVKIINGIEICINDEQMTDEVLSLTERVLSEYPKKIFVIADYLSKNERFMTFYGDISKEGIVKKLHEPNMCIDNYGGLLSYCNHEFDAVHIIDLEFAGALEKFYDVSING